MAFYQKKSEPIPEVETKVWSCVNEDCSSWMREDFTFEEKPTCPKCQSEMVKETRVLPQIS
ncbi:cold-shock protein [Bacillaceae bacterium S4-13-58]